MAKKENKKYSVTDKDFEAMYYCNKKDIAFFISKVDQENEKYNVIKYNISKFNNVSYMRSDLTQKASFRNRLALKEFDAMEKVFEYYNKTKEKLEGIELEKQEVAKPTIVTRKENHQIDLLEMIADVENESAKAD